MVKSKFKNNLYMINGESVNVVKIPTDEWIKEHIQELLEE